MRKKDMLGDVLRKLVCLPAEWLGAVYDLSEKLAGQNGATWFEDLKAFLRAGGVHLIDLDADPFVPDGLTVEEHIKGGRFEFDPQKIGLYLDKAQQSNVIGGHQLRDELKGQPVFNANLLDWLLAHPHLIPEEWKGKFVHFWGTIYRGEGGDLYVRCLYWSDNGQWYWNHIWLDIGFDGNYLAAVSTS